MGNYLISIGWKRLKLIDEIEHDKSNIVKKIFEINDSKKRNAKLNWNNFIKDISNPAIRLKIQELKNKRSECSLMEYYKKQYYHFEKDVKKLV